MKRQRKKKNKFKRIIFFLFAVVILGLGGYVSYKYLTNEDENADKDEVKEPVKKVQIVDLESNSRPYAVMINNNSAVWKYQSGLNDAYIVYEMLVEGGITREMAIFKDADVEKIQSIRSARHYFLDYALENDAIYIHWGWSPQAQKDIKRLGINNLNGLTYEGTYFFRDKSVGAAYEHKGYTKMSSLKAATAKLGYRSTTSKDVILKYSVDPIDLSANENVEDAKYVEIKFSGYQTSKFIYDENKKVYTKMQNKTDMIDYTSKEPFTAKNIITYKVKYSNIVGDDKGRLDLSNIGTGTGYYISEGKAVPITWEKKARSSKTIYKYEDGSELKVNDGNTYIELQPNTQSLKLSAEVPE